LTQRRRIFSVRESIRKYPKSRWIRIEAWLTVLAWVVLLVLLVGVVMSWTSFEAQGKSIAVWAMGIFFFTALASVSATLGHKCPVCRKRPTVEGFAPLHEFTKHENGLVGGSRVAWRVFRNRPFRCIHCGEQFVAE